MRKLFFSAVMMTPDKPDDRVVYQSRDFDMGDRKYFAPISYLLDANIDEKDDILIITTIAQNKSQEDNYKILRKEMETILVSHNANATFVEIYEPDYTDKEKSDVMDLMDFMNLKDSLTCNRYFQEISDYLQDGDRIYTDMTFGMKCNTIFRKAISHAVKAGKDVDVECMVCAQCCNGENESDCPTFNIIDITDVEKAHKYSNNHKAELEKDSICGCFSCMEIYSPKEIEEWIIADNDCDRKGTAICPKCGIDSVIGESSGYPITKDFLMAMHKHWFH